MNIGFKIRKLREEKKITQPALAYELNISQSELSKIENGKTKRIDFLVMSKVCKIFEKDFDYFIQKGMVLENKKIKEITNIDTLSADRIINEMKKIIHENIENKVMIDILKEENENLKHKKSIK